MFLLVEHSCMHFFISKILLGQPAGSGGTLDLMSLLLRFSATCKQPVVAVGIPPAYEGLDLSYFSHIFLTIFVTEGRRGSYWTGLLIDFVFSTFLKALSLGMFL